MSVHGLALRRAITQRLRADAGVTALVAADRIYGDEPPAEPEWPFVKYLSLPVLPYESSCGRGDEATVQISAFAYGPGTDDIWAIASAIREALDDASLTLATGIDLVSIDWTSTQILREPDVDASAYHAAVQIRAITVEAT